MSDPFVIGAVSVRRGAIGRTELPIASLATGSPVSMPLVVVHGRHDGPTIWLDAAIHGDEVNGVEIIRRVLERVDPDELCGTVLAVPVVNAPGFLIGSRHPDRDGRRVAGHGCPGDDRRCRRPRCGRAHPVSARHLVERR